MLNARTVGAVCVALVMVAGTGSSLVMAQAAKKKAAPKAAGGPAPTAEEVASAEEIYKTKCAVCHTLEGNSPIPNMNFADGAWLHGRRSRKWSTPSRTASRAPP